MGSRVFVRLFDGARETDDVVLTLPPPPLKWTAVLGAMVAAIERADADDDDDDAPAVAPERLTRARLFLLPGEALGLVAELNARGLRGIRENDRFVVCLQGEDYQKRAEAQAAALSAVSTDVAADAESSKPADHEPLATTSSSSTGSAAPPSGVVGFGSLGMKGSKRYRSISGKMAAIKSLGDKGLISAEDRGHLKDLLLNNDSPQLQEALDQYNSTGDFQAVKAILLAELRKPSTKRSVGGDWISDTLVNDITANFNTGDSSDPPSAPVQNQALPTSSPFMYQAPESSSAPNSIAGSPFNRQASPMAPTTHLRDPVFQQVQPDQQQQHLTATSIAYGQMQFAQGVYRGGGVLPHVNLPMRNRNSMNLMLKQAAFGAPQAPMMGPPSLDMRYGGVGGTPGYSNQLESVAPSPMYAPGMAYAPPDYSNRVGGLPQQYGFVLPGNPGGFSTTALHQQQQQSFGMTRFPYGSPGLANGGYDYYSSGGFVGGVGGGFDKSQMRHGGKWTTAPPMPSYPPACSKEEKKEKIAKWLKKRENRNWSNKPSYPVRHSIAKSRKRGEDGRFITKARLAEMALEAAAANGGAGNGSTHDSGDADPSGEMLHHHPDVGGPEVFDDYEQHLSMASLPAPTPVP